MITNEDKVAPIRDRITTERTQGFVIKTKQPSYRSLNKKVIQQAHAEAFCGGWCGAAKTCCPPRDEKG